MIKLIWIMILLYDTLFLGWITLSKRITAANGEICHKNVGINGGINDGINVSIN